MTKIEWTEQTWNPVVGCIRVSPGCARCYAERMARRLEAMGQAKYQGLTDVHGRWNGTLTFDHQNYDAPRRRQKPTVYFVSSMSDLFHPNLPVLWLMRIWGVMADTPQHTYQILTKRPEVMRLRVEMEIVPAFGILPNVWLGTSVETRPYAAARIPDLVATPAALRFLSCEPLLGQLDLRPWLGLTTYDLASIPIAKPQIDWVIAGGESGPGARPCDETWLHRIALDCRRAGVAVFIKQMGSVWAKAHGSRSKGGDVIPDYLKFQEMPHG